MEKCGTLRCSKVLKKGDIGVFSPENDAHSVYKCPSPALCTVQFSNQFMKSWSLVRFKNISIAVVVKFMAFGLWHTAKSYFSVRNLDCCYPEFAIPESDHFF